MRRPQKAAPTEKGAGAEHKTEPPTAYRHGTAPPRTFASLCVILQTAAAKNFGVTVLRRRPPKRGEPSVSESAAETRRTEREQERRRTEAANRAERERRQKRRTERERERRQKRRTKRERERRTEAANRA